MHPQPAGRTLTSFTSAHLTAPSGGELSMTMSEHTELVAEIAYVEKLTPQERLKHAKKRRQQQLKKFGQYEKHLLKEQAKKQKAGLPISPPPKSSRTVEFVSHVVLLEAASRNDLEEGKSLGYN